MYLPKSSLAIVGYDVPHTRAAARNANTRSIVPTVRYRYSVSNCNGVETVWRRLSHVRRKREAFGLLSHKVDLMRTFCAHSSNKTTNIQEQNLYPIKFNDPNHLCGDTFGTILSLIKALILLLS